MAINQERPAGNGVRPLEADSNEMKQTSRGYPLLHLEDYIEIVPNRCLLSKQN